MRIPDEQLTHTQTPTERQQHLREVAENPESMPAVHREDLRKHCAAALRTLADDPEHGRGFIRNLYLHSVIRRDEHNVARGIDRVMRAYATTYDGRQLRMDRTDDTPDGYPECAPTYGPPTPSDDIDPRARAYGGTEHRPSFTMVLQGVEREAYRNAIMAAQPRAWTPDETIPPIAVDRDELVRLLLDPNDVRDGCRLGNLTVRDPLTDHGVGNRDDCNRRTDPWIIAIADRELRRVPPDANLRTALGEVIDRHWPGTSGQPKSAAARR